MYGILLSVNGRHYFRSYFLPLHVRSTMLTFWPEASSAKRLLASVRVLVTCNYFEVIFYCSVSKRLRALALLDAAQYYNFLVWFFPSFSCVNTSFPSRHRQRWLYDEGQPDNFCSALRCYLPSDDLCHHIVAQDGTRCSYNKVGILGNIL